MTSVTEGWKWDLGSEEYTDRATITRNSIQRLTKKDVVRQVTSSSSPSEVSVTDCVWLPSQSAALPTFALCALSNGTVCLLNTVNLSKMYLFEDSNEVLKDAKGSAKEEADIAGNSNGVDRRSQYVALDCFAEQETSGAVLGSKEGATCPPEVCVAMDGWVQVSVLDTSSLSELKRLRKGSATKVVAYPPLPNGAKWCRPTVRFDPSGRRVLAVLPTSQEGIARDPATMECSPEYHAFITVLKKSEPGAGKLACVVEVAWADLNELRPATTSMMRGSSTAVRYCGWLDETFVLCVWSDGLVQVLDSASLCCTAECDLLERGSATTIKKATATGVFTLANALPRQTYRCAGSPAKAVLAVALDDTVVSTFTVHLTEHTSVAGLKRARDGVEDGSGGRRYLLRLHPTPQTFCSEENPVVDVSLIHVFSWTLCLLLESGALLFLDAMTLEVLAYRPVPRLDNAPVLKAGATGASSGVFCRVIGKPFSASVIEHNTITLLKAQ